VTKLARPISAAALDAGTTLTTRLQPDAPGCEAAQRLKQSDFDHDTLRSGRWE